MVIPVAERTAASSAISAALARERAWPGSAVSPPPAAWWRRPPPRDWPPPGAKMAGGGRPDAVSPTGNNQNTFFELGVLGWWEIKRGGEQVKSRSDDRVGTRGEPPSGAPPPRRD